MSMCNAVSHNRTGVSMCQYAMPTTAGGGGGMPPLLLGEPMLMIPVQPTQFFTQQSVRPVYFPCRPKYHGDTLI